jgi:hypothetical protein
MDHVPSYAPATSRPHIDLAGIGLSALCCLHCVALPFIASGMLAWVASEGVHIGVTLALSFIVFAAAVPGYRRHRRSVVPVLFGFGLSLIIGALLGEDALGGGGETLLTLAGSGVLISAHVLNLRLRSQRK